MKKAFSERSYTWLSATGIFFIFEELLSTFSCLHLLLQRSRSKAKKMIRYEHENLYYKVYFCEHSDFSENRASLTSTNQAHNCLTSVIVTIVSWRRYSNQCCASMIQCIHQLPKGFEHVLLMLFLFQTQSQEWWKNWGFYILLDCMCTMLCFKERSDFGSMCEEDFFPKKYINAVITPNEQFSHSSESGASTRTEIVS